MRFSVVKLSATRAPHWLPGHLLPCVIYDMDSLGYNGGTSHFFGVYTSAPCPAGVWAQLLWCGFWGQHLLCDITMPHAGSEGK